jgi:predicted NUDIX family NTP pyrophosphohydrolase
MGKVSAGILLFRRVGDGAVEVLLAHPGGPLWAAKDVGAWSIPKGEADDGETGPVELLAVARREFEEETGHAVPDGRPAELGEVRLKSGKVIHGWALEGDLDPATATSSTFELDWPPRSGRRRTYPEVDRVAWSTPDEARERLNPAQVPFVERLLEELAARRG